MRLQHLRRGRDALGSQHRRGVWDIAWDQKITHKNAFSIIVLQSDGKTRVLAIYLFYNSISGNEIHEQKHI